MQLEKANFNRVGLKIIASNLFKYLAVLIIKHNTNGSV